MNNTKSTPLSHLPSQGSAAVSSSQDILPADDDSTIQEVLSQLTGGGSGGSSSSPPQSSPPTPPSNKPANPQQPSPSMLHQLPHSHAPLDPSTTALLNSLMNGAANVGPAISAPPALQTVDGGNSVMNIVMLALTEDFKLASIVFAVFVAIHFVPITNVLGRYFSLEKIPYSEIVIKGAIVAIVVTFAKKAFIK